MRSLKIMVVDDVDHIRQLLEKFITQLGHDVVLAEDGLQAVAMFQQEMPDLIIMDVMMPNMSGFEATKEIRQRCGEKWVPILFLTAVDQVESVVKGLEVGGDDYLVKPVNLQVLHAKIGAFHRSIEFQYQALERQDELAQYYAVTEGEKRLAKHVMEQLIQHDKLRDKMLRFRVSPAQDFSGDVVAAARTPGDVLHVLLADGAGHGLAAALNVLPVTQPFYAMTESGFGIGSIAAELNKKVRQLLPVDRFVATTLVSVDFSEQVVQVWNGGNPAPMLVNVSGKLLEFPIARHVPLGILSEREFDATVSYYPFREACQLVLYSDGVTEAENAAKQQFGRERLLDVIANGLPEKRCDDVVHALTEHLAGMPIADDTSLVLIDCIPDIGYRDLPSQAPHAIVADGEEAWQMQVKLSASELRYVDVVPLLLNFIGHIEVAKQHGGKVFLIVSELFNNALDHGILRLDSKLKQQPDGFERYLSMRGERLAALKEGFIGIGIEQLIAQDVAQLRISVSDSGMGFDFSKLQNQVLHSTSQHGRGLGLVKSLCSALEFHNNGSQIVAYYNLQQPTVTALAA